MNNDQYIKIIETCKTREELVRLIENTVKKKRDDLAIIADKYLQERFPLQNKWTASSGKSPMIVPYEEAKKFYKTHSSLNKDQIEFLAKYGVPEESIFNATGLRTSTYIRMMGEGDFDIAYGTTACKKYGHTLRTSSGACIQCDPSKFSYLLRHRRLGEVYVAESNTNNTIVKVGCCKSSHERLTSLNSEKYAGRYDWRLKFYHGVQNMGLVESEVHASLNLFAISNMYYLKEGEKTLCREIFSCSSEVAIEILNKAIKKDQSKRLN